jgi:GNAT superfamily N-acetyltransferase
MNPIPSTRRATHDESHESWKSATASTRTDCATPRLVTAADCAAFIDRTEMWVWVEDGQILGFSAGDPRDGSIWALFVDPANEGGGIGLLALACNTVRFAGFDTATLSTEPGRRADRFYRLNGWVETGRSAKGEAVFQRRLEESHR